MFIEKGGRSHCDSVIHSKGFPVKSAVIPWPRRPKITHAMVEGTTNRCLIETTIIAMKKEHFTQTERLFMEWKFLLIAGGTHVLWNMSLELSQFAYKEHNRRMACSEIPGISLRRIINVYSGKKRLESGRFLFWLIILCICCFSIMVCCFVSLYFNMYS